MLVALRLAVWLAVVKGPSPRDAAGFEEDSVFGVLFTPVVERAEHDQVGNVREATVRGTIDVVGLAAVSARGAARVAANGAFCLEHDSLFEIRESLDTV